MKSKIIEYSLIFVLLPASFPIAAQAQMASVFPLTRQSQTDSTLQGGYCGMPLSDGQLNYEMLRWKESNDDALSALKCYYKGQYKDAERLGKKSMEKAPLTSDGQRHESNERAVQALAMVYIRQGKYAEVIKLYDDLYAANPSTFYGSSIDPLNLALSYLRLGKYDLALQYYKRYEKITYLNPGPTDPPASDYPGTDTPTKLEASILMNRGAYIAGFGSQSEGLIDLRQAHVLLPDNPIVAYYLVRNLSLEKDAAESLELYKIIEKNGHGKSMVDEAKNRRSLLEYVIAHPGK
jgi:tetratricopeptide (TPR) repeat protein